MDKERIVSYGKGDVFAYRTYVTPLTGVKPIPESSFTGRSNIIFGVNIKVEVSGKKLLSSFTEGDNSLIVATDSMKNFIQRHLGSYKGSTIEGFIKYTGEQFLRKYSHIDKIVLTGEEVPFETVNKLGSGGIQNSDLVFKSSRNERAFASIELTRSNETYKVVQQKSGLKDLQLIKVKGNSFIGFIRDEYTTLPEDSNRPLFIYLNIGWEYEDDQDSVGENPSTFVCAEQIRDLSVSVFHELETPSIQYLIYVIGSRILTRFPQLKEVTFQSQNHTWDTILDKIENSEGKVYTEPRPPYGFQYFSLTKDDLLNEGDIHQANKLK